MKKTITRALSLLLALLICFSGLQLTAFADSYRTVDSAPTDRLVRIRYPYNGNYLMVESESNGSRLKQKPLSPNDDRFVFRLHQTEDGYHKLYTLAGNVIEIRNFSHDDWAEAAVWSDHDGLSAKWNLISADNTVKFSNANSGKNLNVAGRDGENLIQYHSDGTAAEAFSLEPYTKDVLVRLRYHHSGRYLDIPIDKVHENGTQLQLWDYTGRDNQLFRMHPVGGGYMQIFSVLDNKLVEVRNSSHEDCEDVAMWNAHDLTCGQWSLYANADGTYRFLNRESQLFMNIAGGEGGNGNPIWQYHNDETYAMNFDLIPVDPQAYSQAIVQLAESQIGNDGTRYWDWSHKAPGTDWCAMFVSWLADQCGYLNKVIPNEYGCGDMARYFQARQNQWVDGTADPKPGYIIFYTDAEHVWYTHVGLVVGFSNGTISTIEGNWGGRVSDRSVSLDDPKIHIRGYGIPAYWKAPILP